MSHSHSRVRRSSSDAERRSRRSRSIATVCTWVAATGLSACGVAPVPDAGNDAMQSDIVSADRLADVARESAVNDASDGSMDAADGASATDASDGSFDSSPDAAAPNLFADLIGCTRDEDCPSGTGVCVTSLPVARTVVGDAGTTTVAIAMLFPGRAMPGVCSLDCSANASVCNGLRQPRATDGGVSDASASMDAADGANDSAAPSEGSPFVCQLVYAGRHPYPSPRPSFPFAVSAAAMQTGVPFAAMCRPRFANNDEAAARYCEACTSSDACGAGVCWDLEMNVPLARAATGRCVRRPLESGNCPATTTAREVAGQRYCVPMFDTCGACSDRDNDGRGVGLCRSTAADCDESDANSYWGAAEACGLIDRNCNGQVNEGNAPGCTPFFADVDRDGYGMSSSVCLCGPTGVFTATRGGDCDDSNAAIFPGSAYTSTGRQDTNCDGVVTHVYTGVAYCDAVTCFTVGAGTTGWNLFTGAEPDCGETGAWGGCTGAGGTCHFDPLVQRCH